MAAADDDAPPSPPTLVVCAQKGAMASTAAGLTIMGFLLAPPIAQRVLTFRRPEQWKPLGATLIMRGPIIKSSLMAVPIWTFYFYYTSRR